MTSRPGRTNRTARTIRELNRRSRELLPNGTAEPGAFFCECGNDGCEATVWLTPDRYDELVRAGATLLASGHEQPLLAAVLRGQLEAAIARRSDAAQQLLRRPA